MNEFDAIVTDQPLPKDIKLAPLVEEKIVVVKPSPA